MSRSFSHRLQGLVALAGAGVVAALATGRPELAVLAVPFVLRVGIGLLSGGEPRLSAVIELERSRLLEGDQARAVVTVRNDGNGRLELELGLASSGPITAEPSGSIVFSLSAGQGAAPAFALRPERWGAHVIGPLRIRARDPFGLDVWSGELGRPVALRVFPREQRLRELVPPLRTQPFLGAHVARTRGDGIEFADVRPFATGDRVRQVNWRVSARRGSLYATARHPEHASDVVLLLDTFAEARDQASGTLDAAVRAAASLARAHLARRDRVALVDFGGGLHWLEPAFGTSQLYRIIDALLASEIVFSYAWRAVDSIPRRVLPPAALVLAVTPLLDERSIRLITELRARGCDLTVIEVSPLARTPPGPTAADALAHRLWQLQREALRTRLQALGIGVARWDEDAPLWPALEGVTAFRRSARQAVRA